MIKLTDRLWKEFRIENIFDIYPGKRLTKADMKKGRRPFIGATDSNNGITEWVSNSNESLDRNVLGVNYNGSVGEVFYHAYECIFSDDVKRLHLKNTNLTNVSDSNYFVMLFLKTTILQQKIKYAYGYKFNESRMLKQTIMLPVTADEQPDYQFMEDYMREQEISILKPTIKALCKQLNISILGGGKSSLANLNWKEFVFGKEFDISATRSGIDKIKLITGDGQTPYITRTDVRNGIDSFVPAQSSKYRMDEGNVITIGLDTQTVFYQPTAFYTGQNIQVIRHPKLDRYNAMFLIVAIKKLVERFSWGSYGATLTRLRKSRIYLPANEKGEIDFEYMSSFMRQHEDESIKIALQYFEKRLTA